MSHDYEYFAYQGALDVEDYRLNDGSLVTQPQLKTQLLQHEKLVFSYSSSEFTDVLYGKRKKRAANEPDFCVFKLEHSSQVEAFQRVLTRTLRLDKLRSNEVKDYLLSIFRRDLPDANIDFKKEWDSAFAEVNIERAHYQAALKQQEEIKILAQKQQERLVLRGKLTYLRPIINQQLDEWEDYFNRQKDLLQHQLAQANDDLRQLLTQNSELTKQQLLTQQDIDKLQHTINRQVILAHQFALVPIREMLESNHRYALARFDEQTMPLK